MKGSKHLRILCTNAFGLASKLSDLQHALLQHQPDVAIVTETKFTAEKVLPSDVSFPGYSSPLRLDRTAHGGGEAIWVESSLPSMLISELMSPAHEIIWVSLQLAPGLRTVLGEVYRRGSCAPCDLTLIDHLDNILPEARHQGSHIILIGDFNVHNLAWLNSSKTTPAGEALEDTCAAHLLVQHVTVPTRGYKPLDLIMSTFTFPVTTRILPPLGRSDHAVVLSDFSSVLPRREPPNSEQYFATTGQTGIASGRTFATWNGVISSRRTQKRPVSRLPLRLLQLLHSLSHPKFWKRGLPIRYGGRLNAPRQRGRRRSAGATGENNLMTQLFSRHSPNP